MKTARLGFVETHASPPSNSILDDEMQLVKLLLCADTKGEDLARQTVLREEDVRPQRAKRGVRAIPILICSDPL